MTKDQDKNDLNCINAALPDSWEAKLIPDQGRIYYVDHKMQMSSWLPPRENWDPGTAGLPYGWEGAIDRNRKPYFINHLDNYTTHDDPRDDPDYIEPPKPREVELTRDALKGFGFVAGSEKPVVVRFVTEGGPSVDKLLPGDQLIKINGQDVKRAPREYVIDLVRACKQTIFLTVCQPYNDNAARKSALLTAAKKDRLKKNPSRVRFAEEITINGATVTSNSPEESYVPIMPNVLKVFLENGQTKSFKYDNKTSVKDVINSLQEKLNLKCVQHFSLVLHNMKSHVTGRMTLLQEHETIAEIAGRPGARHFRCLFRLVYIPKDAYDLLKKDPIAFEYFFTQCVNDVLQDRFASELKSDQLLRLSALHIQQHAVSNNMTGKINIKNVEKEFGLEKFVPRGLRESMKIKDLRKILTQCLKMNQNLTAPGQKQLTALQAKLHYMKILNELNMFGSRIFMVTLLDKMQEAMVLIGPKSGVSLVTNVRSHTDVEQKLSMLADFSEIQCMKVAKEKDNMSRVELTIRGDHPGTLNFGLLKEDALNFVSMVNGYFRIFVDANVNLVQKNAGKQSDHPEIPWYDAKHTVLAAPWSYPEDIVSMVIEDGSSDSSPLEGTRDGETERVVDLSSGPPAYEGNKEYIKKLKHDLGIKVDENFSSLDIGDEGKTANENLSNEIMTLDKDVKMDQSPIILQETGKNHEDTSSLSSSSSSTMSQNSEEGSHMLLPSTRKLQNGSPMLDTSRDGCPTPEVSRQHGLTDRKSCILEYTDGNDYANASKMKSYSNISGNPQTASGNIDKIMYINSFGTKDNSSDEVQYVNIPRNNSRKLNSNGNSSDTDSGVGGEPDRIVSNVQDSFTDIRSTNGSLGLGTASDITLSDKDDLDASLNMDIHLNSMLNPSFGYIQSNDEPSPSSAISLDPESLSFMGPFDASLLPDQVQGAVYDPHLYSNHEIYLDPDIIDLTLLPPFPPTEEELLAESHNSKGHRPLARIATISVDSLPGSKDDVGQCRHIIQKCVSVGYCPDFLDQDIDAIINRLAVQPPPTTDNCAKEEQKDKLEDCSWNGSLMDIDVVFNRDHPELSHTIIELGSLALDEQYSALVIPPPPEESLAVQDILIVPPVESVKEKKKKFENSFSKGYKLNDVDKISDIRSIANCNTTLEGQKQISISMVGTADDSDNKKLIVDDETVSQNDSPASVSEKLNALLKSLSSYENDDQLGKFHRTSSLRLSHSSSLDFLTNLQNTENKGKHAHLVTGSARVKPKVRPMLMIGKPSGIAHVKIPLKISASLERVHSSNSNMKIVNTENSLSDQENTDNSRSGQSSDFQRAHSFDVLPQVNTAEKLPTAIDSPISENFAALKAKLQSYRDSLLNRSLRHKKKKAKGLAESDRLSLKGEDEQKQSSLLRSNSFSQLVQKSLGRSLVADVQNGQASSASKISGSESVRNEVKEVGGLYAKDRKVWSTLTATRSNFRPNSNMAQTQTKKQKAGPVKALSAFDQAEDNKVVMENIEHFTVSTATTLSTTTTSTTSSTTSCTTEKMPKRMAPEAPIYETPVSPVLSSITVPMSSVLTTSNSFPLAESRHKHNIYGTVSGECSISVHSDLQSKDDGDIMTTTKSCNKPYNTVGKMWRPMSMSTSVTPDQENPYQTYNNFDVLREMMRVKVQLPPDHSSDSDTHKAMPDGHVETKIVSSAGSGQVSKGKGQHVEDSCLVSEKSFALLREKGSASHSNTVKKVLDTVYTSEDFVEATKDVDRLLNELKQTMASLKSSRIDRKPVQFKMCKDELQTQVRQFVTDAKLLVSNANQTKEKLALNMDTSIHSLAKIFLHGQATMFMMEAIHQAQHLGSDVIRVATAYKSTLNAAQAAVGKPLTDPHMKYLMRQATNLASLLSNLLKSLKTLEQK